MPLRRIEVGGLDYLELVTTLLQEARQRSPTGGLWEAADLQWWWRRDQHSDPSRQVFWLDGDRPVAASILTDWGGRFSCDIISADHDLGPIINLVWPRTLEQLDSVANQPVELAVGADDNDLMAAAGAAGFQATDEIGVATWMAAASRPTPAPLPAGFGLAAWSDTPGNPRLRDVAMSIRTVPPLGGTFVENLNKSPPRSHPLTMRTPGPVAQRLLECSLYQPDLDLAVYAPDGAVAAYGLFWADPVTRVGLVEPMRTEDAFQGRGLARHLLAEGLNRLGDRGCTRFKVSYIVGNEASRRLYLGAGFEPGLVSHNYRRIPVKEGA